MGGIRITYVIIRYLHYLHYLKMACIIILCKSRTATKKVFFFLSNITDMLQKKIKWNPIKCSIETTKGKK